MILSSAAVFASAEEDTDWLVIDSIQATGFAQDDPETVTRLEMTLHAAGRNVTFDTLNSTQSFPVCEEIYANTAYNIAKASGELEGFSSEKDMAKYQAFRKSAEIGTVKPVSFADGVLTLDVFSADGTPGTKMVTFGVLSEERTRHAFYFMIPEGLLSDSGTGKVNLENSMVVPVWGLTVRPIGLSDLEKIVVYAATVNDLESRLLLLPLAIAASPVLICVTFKVGKALSDVYGLDYNGLIQKTLRSIPQILKHFIEIQFR